MQLRASALLLVLAATLALGVAGCSSPDPTATRGPSATATIPPTPTATTTPAPTSTPTPAPSPVSEAPPGFKTYLDEESGFAFHYPDSWEEDPLIPGPLVTVRSPDDALEVRTYTLLEATNLEGEQRHREAVDALLTFLNIFDASESPRGEVDLPGGHTGVVWDLKHGPDLQDTLRVMTTNRRLLTYIVTTSGPTDVFEAERETLTAVEESFTLFLPAPYEIARSRALTIPWDDPITLDPAMSRESQSHLVVAHLFSGLTRFDEELRVQLDLAESVELDGAGTTYTFRLREDATFHDGRQITADDVRYSLERAADPDLRSDTAPLYLTDIVGASDKLAGDAATISGIQVVDERTIRLTIDEPKAYFLAKLTYPTAAVVDRRDTERGVEWWRGTVNGSGPFVLDRWDEGEVLILKRYDGYHSPSSLEYAIMPILQGSPFTLYETDFVDVASIGGAQIDFVRDPVNGLENELTVYPQFNTFFVGFNTETPPFDDPDVRRAFSMAVDRTYIVDVLFAGQVALANSLLPPGMPGHSEGLLPSNLVFDVVAAQAALVSSSYGGVEGLPRIVFTASGLGDVGVLTQYMIDSWRENLGVEVQVRQLSPEAYFYQLDEEVDNLFNYGWVADYPDPENFLDLLLHSDTDNNIGGYADPAYDALLEQARSAADHDERMALYQRAEALMLAQAPILPLYHSPDYVLVKPRIDGFRIGPLGIPLLQNVTVGPE